MRGDENRGAHWVMVAAGLGCLALLVLLQAPWRVDGPVTGAAKDSEAFGALVSFWLWWAAAANLVVLAGLWFTRSIWLKPLPPEASPVATDPPCPASRSAKVLLALSMMIAAWNAWPRLTQSLWGDEHIAVQSSILGRATHDPEADGLAESLNFYYWEEAEWKHTLWQYETTNPHFALNALARLSHTWLQPKDAPLGEINEFALRISPFLAGLASLAAWFVLIRRFGFERAAPWAVLLLSVHPWFIQYVSEARGYALVFLFLPLTLLAVHNALVTQRWRWWTAFAGFQFALLYSWPGMAVFAICLNIAVLVRLLRMRKAAAGQCGLRRWVVANTATAMVLLQLVAPCFAQVGDYLRDDMLRMPVGAAWFKDLVGRFFVGIDWIDHSDLETRSPLYLTLEGLVSRSWLRAALVMLAAAVLGTAFLAGIVRWWKAVGNHRLVLLAMAASMAAIYLPSALSGTYVFQWYYVYALPFAAALVGIGLEPMARRVSSSRGVRGPDVPLAFALLVLYAVAAHPQRALLRNHSLDPLRESVIAVRGTLDPMEKGQTRMLCVHAGNHARGYDLLGWAIEKASGTDAWPGLVQLMRMADVHGKELVVILGTPHHVREEQPDLARMLETPELFEQTSPLHGMGPQFRREIYRYRGGMFDVFRRPPVEKRTD